MQFCGMARGCSVVWFFLKAKSITKTHTHTHTKPLHGEGNGVGRVRAIWVPTCKASYRQEKLSQSGTKL